MIPCFILLFSFHAASLLASNNDEILGPPLKILSWNIQMLPSAIKQIGQHERSEYIAAHLNESDYDVIIFQEAFDNNVREKLSEYLRSVFPYQEGPANSSGFFIRTNSGIWIVSKHPMKFISEIKYNHCNGVDCLSRKGALMVEIKKDGKSVQIAGTHLQAGYAKMFSKVRVKQYRQLHDELLSPYSRAGVPQIICGDFNTPKDDDVYYEIMMNTLNADDGNLDGELQFSYDGSLNDMIKNKNELSLLDYIFIKSNKVRYHSVVRTVKTFTAGWHGTKQHLSDHFALEITLN